MLIGRQHVPGKLDRTLPITTIFVFVAIVSREVTLTFCWQLLMPMNCHFVASDIVLFVSVTGQACSQGPCAVSGRRPKSSRCGCGPDRVPDVFTPDAENRSGLIRVRQSDGPSDRLCGQENGEFSCRAELSWLADELCWLRRVWTVTRQP